MAYQYLFDEEKSQVKRHRGSERWSHRHQAVVKQSSLQQQVLGSSQAEFPATTSTWYNSRFSATTCTVPVLCPTKYTYIGKLSYTIPITSHTKKWGLTRDSFVTADSLTPL
jgi:hypothetical protein